MKKAFEFDYKSVGGATTRIRAKPRIKLSASHFGYPVWVCDGFGGFGLGSTPHKAYEAWHRFVKFYGLMGAPAATPIGDADKLKQPSKRAR